MAARERLECAKVETESASRAYREASEASSNMDDALQLARNQCSSYIDALGAIGGPRHDCVKSKMCIVQHDIIGHWCLLLEGYASTFEDITTSIALSMGKVCTTEDPLTPFRKGQDAVSLAHGNPPNVLSLFEWKP